MSSLKTRLEKLEAKVRPETQEHLIWIWEGKEDEAEEKKKKILEKNPNATFHEIRFVWAKYKVCACQPR